MSASPLRADMLNMGTDVRLVIVHRYRPHPKFDARYLLPRADFRWNALPLICCRHSFRPIFLELNVLRFGSV